MTDARTIQLTPSETRSHSIDRLTVIDSARAIQYTYLYAENVLDAEGETHSIDRFTVIDSAWEIQYTYFDVDNDIARDAVINGSRCIMHDNIVAK